MNVESQYVSVTNYTITLQKVSGSKVTNIKSLSGSYKSNVTRKFSTKGLKSGNYRIVGGFAHKVEIWTHSTLKTPLFKVNR